MQNQSRIISVINAETYPKHLCVMNGIFNRGLKQSSRGAHPLKGENIVWFPRVYAARVNIPEGQWGNVVSQGGEEIREYWNNEEGKERVERGRYKVRFTFGWDMAKNEGWKFLGIFKADHEEDADGRPDGRMVCMVYKRIADSFDASEWC